MNAIPTAESPPFDVEAAAKLIELIMCHGYTFQMAYDISDEKMETMYAWAYELQKQQQFAKAERVFRFLCYLNNYDARFWIALAFCREKLQQPQEALRALLMAGQLDAENPVLPLRCAECFLQLGNLPAAEKSARFAQKLAGDSPRHAEWSQRAAVLLKIINKRVAKQVT